nr:hypothetical protein [Mycobacterium colombiense]
MTITAVAVLSVFIALVAGSSLRPPLGAAALPEPVAWTQHATHDAPAHADQAQRQAIAQPVSHQDRVFSKGATPTDKKPFRNTWMTRAVPSNWTAVSAHSEWLALPASFGPPASPPNDTAGVASAEATPVNRDTSTLLCIVRC